LKHVAQNKTVTKPCLRVRLFLQPSLLYRSIRRVKAVEFGLISKSTIRDCALRRLLNLVLQSVREKNCNLIHGSW